MRVGFKSSEEIHQRKINESEGKFDFFGVGFRFGFGERSYLVGG